MCLLNTGKIHLVYILMGYEILVVQDRCLLNTGEIHFFAF